MNRIGLILPFIATVVFAGTTPPATTSADDSLDSAIQAAVATPAPAVTPTPVPALKIVPPPSTPVTAPIPPGAKPSSPLPAPATAVPVVPGGNNPVFGTSDNKDEAKAVADRLNPGAAADAAITDLIRERARIRLYGDFPADFRGASLGNIAEALATFCQMSYISSSDDLFNVKINITGTKNILDLLDSLSDYGFAMEYQRGIWRFGKKNENSMVLRTYQFHNDNTLVAKITSPTIGNSSNSSSGSNGTGGQSSGSNTGSSGGNLSGSSQGEITVDEKELENFFQGIIQTPYPTASGIQVAATPTGANAPGKGVVKYVPNNSQLIVYASEFHQQLVKDYIEKMDQPLDQIEFSATFVETSRDPSQNVGIAWSPSASINVSGQSPSSAAFKLPVAGIVSAYQLAAALSFSAQDSLSSVEQQPTVVGLPNRKTVLDATRQIPVASSTFNTGSASTTASTNTQLQYIDVGTIVNVYPEVRVGPEGNKIMRLNVSLVVSNIIGSITIAGNPTPETSTRRFEFSADVPDGQSLVVGGLVGNSITYSNTKLPFLGDIPFAGQLFRNDNDSVSRSQLMVYITPHILKPGENASLHVLSRTWPEDPEFNRPYFTAGIASPAALGASLQGFGRELDAMEVFVTQRRDPVALKSRISELHEESKVMKAYVEIMKKRHAPLDPLLVKEANTIYLRATKLRTDIYTSLKL